MKKRPASLSLIPLLLASGCTVGPDYHPPATTAPAQWGEPQPRAAAGLDPAVAWWKTFNDSELDSLVERAVAANLDLRIASARVRQARAEYHVAEAGFWPSVNTSAAYARERPSAEQPLIKALHLPPGSSLDTDDFQAGFDASWEINVFGGTRRAVEAASAEVAAAEFDERATLVTLLGDVARNYVEVRGFQRRLAIARENIAAQQSGLGLTQDRYAHGVANRLDVEQAATLLATTKANVPPLESSLHAAIHRLAVLLGQRPDALMAELLPESPIPVPPPEVPVGLPSDLLRRRPDVRRAERELAAANARIGVATADLFPRFSLTGALGLESVSAGDWFTAGNRFFSVGPTVRWNLFDAGRIRANIRAQDAREEQALAAYEQTVLNAFEDTENAMVAYAQEQVRRQSLTDAATSSRASLDLARQRYTNGLTDFLNVLDAERSVYQAEDELAQSERTVSANLIALYKALGGGWETRMPGER